MANNSTVPTYQSTNNVQNTPTVQFQKIQGDVDNLVDISKKNVDALLDRGDRLDKMQDRAERLNEDAQIYVNNSTQVKRVYQIKNLKMWIILGVLSILILGGIIIGIVFSVKNHS